MAFGVFELLTTSLLILSMSHAQEWAGSYIYNGKCLRYMDELKSWDDALTSCVNMGGTLATVTSYEEWDDIKFYLRIGAVTVWIGANKKTNGATYVWTESNSQATQISGMWATGYPKATAGYDCAYLESRAYNDACSTTHRYICMEPNSGVTKCTAPITTTSATTTNMITSTANTTLAETTVTTAAVTTEKNTASPITVTTTAAATTRTTTAPPTTVTTKRPTNSKNPRRPKYPCKERSKSRRNPKSGTGYRRF